MDSLFSLQVSKNRLKDRMFVKNVVTPVEKMFIRLTQVKIRNIDR